MITQPQSSSAASPTDEENSMELPLKIVVTQGTEDTFPKVSVGRWETIGPIFFPTQGKLEEFVMFKEQIAAANGLKPFNESDAYKASHRAMMEAARGKAKNMKATKAGPFDPIDFANIHTEKDEGDEDILREKIMMVKEMHKYYMKLFGREFNKRLKRATRKAFIDPFHPRFTRLLGNGIKGRGQLIRNGQTSISDGSYQKLWSIRPELNRLAEEHSSWLPLCIASINGKERLSGLLGPDLSEAIEHSAARRIEDVTNALKYLAPLSRDETFDRVEIMAVMAFLLSLPNDALRFCSTNPSTYIPYYMAAVNKYGRNGLVHFDPSKMSPIR